MLLLLLFKHIRTPAKSWGFFVCLNLDLLDYWD
jgi:hypothetical protein